MKNRLLHLITVALFLTQSLHAQKLEQIWATPQLFKTPESVIYHHETGVIYVANINGQSNEKDGNGFISRLSAEGEILNLEWVSGLDAPKGMGILGNKLYVADIDQLVEIDITSAKITRKYPAPGAEFLNDVTICSNGSVFVTDMRTRKIHRLQNGVFEVWFHSEVFNRPNGIFAERGKLYIGDHHIFELDIATQQLTTVIPDAGGVDGLEKTASGQFIYSHWAGRVFLQTDRGIEKLLDTAEDGIQSADIDYAVEIQQLLVPTFNDNRVVAYRIIP